MNFTSLELSEKLIKMGCKSISEFVYFLKKDKPEPSSYCSASAIKKSISCFCLEDFLGSHPTALENCKIIGRYAPLGEGGDRVNELRHAIVDHTAGWVDFLQRAVEAK